MNLRCVFEGAAVEVATNIFDTRVRIKNDSRVSGRVAVG